jgi:hypothetical protein
MGMQKKKSNKNTPKTRTNLETFLCTIISHNPICTCTFVPRTPWVCLSVAGVEYVSARSGLAPHSATAEPKLWNNPLPKKVVNPETPVVVDEVPVPARLDEPLVCEVIQTAQDSFVAIDHVHRIHPDRPDGCIVREGDRYGLAPPAFAEHNLRDVGNIRGCSRRFMKYPG